MIKPVLIWETVLFFLQMLFGFSATTDSVLAEFIPPKWLGLAVVVVAAAQGATVFYKRGGTTVPDVEAPRPTRSRNR